MSILRSCVYACVCKALIQAPVRNNPLPFAPFHFHSVRLSSSRSRSHSVYYQKPKPALNARQRGFSTRCQAHLLPPISHRRAMGRIRSSCKYFVSDYLFMCDDDVFVSIMNSTYAWLLFLPCRRHHWHWTKDKAMGYNFFLHVWKPNRIWWSQNMFLCPVIIAYKSRFALKFRYEKRNRNVLYILSYRSEKSCHHHLKYHLQHAAVCPPIHRIYKYYSKLQIRNGFCLALVAPLFSRRYPIPFISILAEPSFSPMKRAS